jgi:hypothetical protein
LKTRVVVNDRMQQGYTYVRTEPPGKNFAPGFAPDLTPAEMLRLGVFGGKYMTDCRAEFPARWFAKAKLSPSAGRAACGRRAQELRAARPELPPRAAAGTAALGL